MPRASAAALAAAALVVCACGGGKSGGDRDATARSATTGTKAPPATAPGKLNTAAGQEIARVVTDFYTGLEDQDTSLLCRSITPSAREKVIAIGAIQDAKTCRQGYEKIFEQARFHYTDPPKVLRVTISGNRAHATTAFGGETTRAPVRKASGEWKVDAIG